MIEQINHIADLWWSGATAMFWQVGVLIILIGCVDLIIRRWAWPQLRYALWLMVLVKLILPPTISLSTSITSGLQPLARQIVAKESRRENLNAMTAMILTNIENAVVESPVVAVSSRDTVTEQQPALVFTGPENVAGESLNAVYIKPTWQAYVMAIWLAGMFVLGGWLIIKLLHLRKEDLPPASTASLPESFHVSMARCAERLGLRRLPKVVLTRRVACPAVFGMVRPVLLMPVGYLSKMTRRDTENMILHELAHIKRGDLWVHGFYMLLQIVYWYNPLLWRVRSQMHHLRELCCDATVARLLKDKTNEYRQTLIDVARRFLTKPTEPGLGLLGLFEDSNRLLVRLNWLKKETWRHPKMKMLTIITIIGLMLAFVLPMAQAKNPQAEDTVRSEQLQIEKENPEKDNSDPTKDTIEENLPNKASQLSNRLGGATEAEISIDEGEKDNSREIEGTAQLDVTVSLTVRGKKIDNHRARVRLLDAKDRHEIQRIEKGENGLYLFTGVPAGKYVVEAYFWDSYPEDFVNVTLAKGEQKSILIDSKTEQLARIQVAGKLLDKRTGNGIEGATVHFVGAPKDNAKTYPDGSFATHADRARFHQILARLDEKALRGGQLFRIRMNNHIKEDLASNLQIHIDPEYLPQRQELRDEDGDGIFCDGIGCVICPLVRRQNQKQLSQNLRELEFRLQTLQSQKQKLEKELQALEHSKHTEQAKHQAEQATLKAINAALKAMEAKDQAEKNSKEAEKAKNMAAKAKTSAEARTGKGLISSAFFDCDLVTEVLPVIAAQAGISIIPDETVVGLVTCELDKVPLERALEIVLTDTPYTFKKTQYNYLIYSQGTNATKSAFVRDVKSEPDFQENFVVVHNVNGGKFIATKEMQFVAKVKSGIPFIVRNSLGNIILKPSKDGKCDVKAVIKGKDESPDKARTMVEQVSINLHSSDERYYLKPVKQDGGQWNNLSVDFHITVPLGILPDVKTDLGNIEISNLKGNIKAATDLGSIKAVNTTGNIELFTNLGDIEFIAPKNLSAKLQAQTKMGSIESELPLEINKSDMFKRTAEGTIGTGQASIKMATDMGKISLKWQSSSQDEVKL